MKVKIKPCIRYIYLLFVLSSCGCINSKERSNEVETKKIEVFAKYIAENFRENFTTTEGCRSPYLWGDSIKIAKILFDTTERPYFLHLLVKKNDGSSCEKIISNGIDLHYLNRLEREPDLDVTTFEIDLNNHKMGKFLVEQSLCPFKESIHLLGRNYKNIMYFSNNGIGSAFSIELLYLTE